MTICWHGPGRSGCRAFHAGATLIYWGRCRSGRRWFWAAEEITGERGAPERHGREDTEQAAVAAARAAVAELAGDRPAWANAAARFAVTRLQEANAAARAARPPSAATDPQAVSYLHAAWISPWLDDMTGSFDRAVIPLRIIRKTARRVYYVRDEHHGDPVTGYVDRQALERDGEIRTRHYYKHDYHLFARREDAEAEVFPPAAAPPDLRRLRQEMADAHPDRGGTRDEFMAARQRYLAARAAATRDASQGRSA